MSRISIGTPTGTNAVGFVVIGVSLLLVLAGLFLPWLNHTDFDKSYSGFDLLGLDRNGFAADPLTGTGEAPLNVTYTWNRDTGAVTGDIPVYDIVPTDFGSNLFFVLLMLVLVVFFAAYAYIVQTRKYDFVSSISWIAIVGVYGILFLLFFAFISQGNREQEFRQRLTRAVLANAGQVVEEVPVENVDEATGGDVDAEATEAVEATEAAPVTDATTTSNSGERLSVATISNEVDYSNFDSVTGAIGIGFWITLLGMVGFVAQIFIPRDLTKSSSVTGSSGGYVSSGEVTSDSSLISDTMIRQAIISVAIVFAILPLIFIMASAFNPSGQLSTQGLIPQNVESPEQMLTNFRALMVDELETYPFWNWILNSFIVATTTTILVVLITAMSAYSFSRFRFTGRRSLLLGILLIQVFPNLLAMVALFLILTQVSSLADNIPRALPFLSAINWDWLELFGLNSLGGLILVYMGGAMGINTWLMKGFFDSIPRDIDESALVDGASHWQIFWQLIFPLVRPILAVVGILAFVGTFNEFVLARVLLRDKEKWTLMVGLFNFINAEFNRDWGKFAAGALVSTIPVVAIYIALQDQIVGGLTAGSVKG